MESASALADDSAPHHKFTFHTLISWESIAWWIAFLVCLWIGMLSFGFFRTAFLIAVLTIGLFCVKWGHVTDVTNARRRPGLFSLGLVFAIAAGIYAFWIGRRISANLNEQSRKISQISQLEKRVGDLKTESEQSADKLQEKQQEVEQLQQIANEQQQIIANKAHDDAMKISGQVQRTTITSFGVQDRFGTEIPFERDSRFSELGMVPMDDNVQDPFFRLYISVGTLAYPPNPLEPTTVRTYLARVLQYYALRTIFNAQNPIETFSLSPSRGYTTDTGVPVLVPDAQPYDDTSWSQLVKTLDLNFMFGQRRDGWLPEKLTLPAHSRVALTQAPDSLSFVIAITRPQDFSLEINIVPGMPSSGPIYPPHFVPKQSNRPRQNWLFPYTITSNFKWNGDRDKGEQYRAWATGLFIALRNSLANGG